MTNTPKVSVIVPCYNYGRFISETIDSVLAQTFQDYEVIIVDDGSTDGTTPAVIKQETEKDKRIKAIFSPENKGLSATRNIGIEAAKGNYILPLDSDDKIAPTYLEKAVNLMEKEQADLVYSHIQFFGEKNNILYRMRNQKQIKKRLPFKNYLPVCSLYKKTDWQQFGGYDETMEGYEDWDFWINFVGTDKKFTLVDEVLFYYRVRAGSLSSIAKKIDRQLMNKIKSNHPNIYNSLNYYLTLNYLRYVVRPALFQIRTRKGHRKFRLLGITFFKDKL